MTQYKFKIGDKVRIKSLKRTSVEIGYPKRQEVGEEFVIGYCQLRYTKELPIYSKEDNCDWVLEEDLELVEEEIRVGDEVEIIGNTSPKHYLKIGTIGKVKYKKYTDYGDWEVTGTGEDGVVMNQSLNKNDIRKVTKSNNMNTKQFKNNFGVTSDSEALLEAFAKEAEKLGWKQQNINNESKTHLYFNATVDNTRCLSMLQKGSFWKQSYGGKGYTLPTQWNEAIKAASETIEIKNKFKVGDYVKLVSHKKGSCYNSKIGDVTQIQSKRHQNTIKVNEWAYNVSKGGAWYEDDIRLLTEEELEEYLSVKISGYTAEVENGKIAFGCQAFTKEQLETYLNLLNRKEFNAEITINKEPITKETLQKLLNKLK